MHLSLCERQTPRLVSIINQLQLTGRGLMVSTGDYYSLSYLLHNKTP